MTTSTVTRSRRAFASRPAIVAEAVVALGWIVATTTPAANQASMDGMAPAVSASAVTLWIALVAATMLPSALPAVRHVAVNSLRRRRHRAVGQFVACYLAVWTAFSLAAIAVLGFAPVVDSRLLLVSTLLVAALWQLTPAKRRALRACHRTVPLPVVGWRADAAAMRFGLRNGAACVASCWCLMLVMCCAVGPVLVWGGAIGAGVFLEKTSEQPVHLARMGALVLALIALFAAVPVHLG